VDTFDLWGAKALMETQKFLLPCSLEELRKLIMDCIKSEFKNHLAQGLVETQHTLLPCSLEELKELIRGCIKSEIKNQSETILPNTELTGGAIEVVKAKPELTISQVALMHCYEGPRITRKNADEIAKDCGHRSGEKLYQKFTFFSSNANRRAEPTEATSITFKNKIDLFESVVERLSGEVKSSAIEDLNHLKELFKNGGYEKL